MNFCLITSEPCLFAEAGIVESICLKLFIFNENCILDACASI